ncbi:hypothetical protein N007_20185 [Alicyclobacillus acidoterrestris ATCC 49025]|nr:hypothetical protein N007_20185 [Alicyclobacillus acidoterrestris ATCC 49025]
MDEYGQGIWRYVYSMTKNTAAADDLSQEVFIQAYQHLSQFREGSSMKTWLFVIEKHKCIDYFRSAFVRRVTFHARMDDVSDDSVEERVIASEQRNAVWAALFQLKPDAREPDECAQSASGAGIAGGWARWDVAGA